MCLRVSYQFNLYSLSPVEHPFNYVRTALKLELILITNSERAGSDKKSFTMKNAYNIINNICLVIHSFTNKNSDAIAQQFFFSIALHLPTHYLHKQVFFNYNEAIQQEYVNKLSNIS